MPNSYTALDDILSIACLNPAPRDQVQIAGSDPVLPTNFFIGTAGAAVYPQQVWLLPTYGNCGLGGGRPFRRTYVGLEWLCVAIVLYTWTVKKLPVGTLSLGSTKQKMAAGSSCIVIIHIIGHALWKSLVLRGRVNRLQPK